MKSIRRIASALLLFAAATAAFAQTLPSTIRIGVATGGVGTPPRTGSSSIGIVNAEGPLEKEFENQGRVDLLQGRRPGRPQIVQRVVTTVVKAARNYSDEQQRGE